MKKNKLITPKSALRTTAVQLLAVLTAVLGVGCTLYESETIEIIYAPQVVTSYDSDPYAEYYRNSRYFIYDNAGILVRDSTFVYDGATELPNYAPSITTTKNKKPVAASVISPVADKAAGHIIFKGLPEGEYRLLAFHNAEQCQIEGVQQGVSTIDELRLVTKTADHAATDRMFTNSNIVTLQRGIKTQNDIGGTPLFYKVNVTFTKVDDMSAAPLAPYILLDNIRTSYTCDGIADIASEGVSMDTIKLAKVAGGNLFGQELCNKFTDEDLIVLKLYEEHKGLIEVIDITPSDWLDFKSTELPVLNVKMEYSNNKFFIWINDYFVYEQDIPVGG